MKSYALPIAFIVAVLIMAHLVVPDPYLWYLNSISQLGAQTYDKAWVMRAGFIGFGLLVQLSAITRICASRMLWYRELPIMIYGLAIIFSGIFSAEPFLEGAPYSRLEASIHSAAAMTAGIALSLAILVHALTDTPNSRRAGHFVALILVTGLSLLFGLMPNVAGVVQRLLWIAGFGWLLYLTPRAKAGRDPHGVLPSA
jgi:hypothetical membrane protein